MPKDHRPPDPHTISSAIYFILLVMAIVLVYVAVRSLF